MALLHTVKVSKTAAGRSFEETERPNKAPSVDGAPDQDSQTLVKWQNCVEISMHLNP